MRSTIFTGFLLLLLNYLAFAQNPKIDSLQKILTVAKEDTNRVNAWNGLADELKRNNPDTCLYFATQALALSEKLKYDRGVAEAKLWLGTVNATFGKNDEALQYLQQSMTLINSSDPLKNSYAGKKTLGNVHHKTGAIYFYKGDYATALKEYTIAIKIREEIGDKKGMADSRNNIGNIYKGQGNYTNALKEYFGSLKLREDIGDKYGVAMSHNNIGIINFDQGNYAEAFNEYCAAMKIYKELRDTKGLAGCHSNIGSVYGAGKKHLEALEEYLVALRFFEELGEKYSIAHTHNNLGSVYNELKRYPEALAEYRISLDIRKEIGDKYGVSDSYQDLATVHLRLKQIREAKEYALQSIQIGKEIGAKENLSVAYQTLATCDSSEGNYKNAFNDYKLFISYRDSLVNEDNTKKNTQTEMQYEFEKKEAIADAEHKKEMENRKKVTDAENKKQKAIIWSVVGGLLLVVLFAAFVSRSLNLTRKQNQVIEAQKFEVERSKHIIEEKNKDITDSINYARRIQKAMLPHRKEIWNAFPQSFVLYKPKDIVSGDFYFFRQKGNIRFIATADCTGHGVPGAFMSLIGSNKLEEAVTAHSDAGEILSILNRGIKTVLKQSEGEGATRDGMDIAFCSVDTENRLVRYSGANRPLWIIRKGKKEVEELKATKKAIGGFTDDGQIFESHEIRLDAGDTLYLFTDGYADAFGDNGKKFMTKRFKEVLLSIQEMPMKDQEKHLDEHITAWMAGAEQVDDILVIGIRM